MHYEIKIGNTIEDESLIWIPVFAEETHWASLEERHCVQSQGRRDLSVSGKQKSWWDGDGWVWGRAMGRSLNLGR